VRRRRACSSAFRTFPKASSRACARAFVNRETLARLARGLGLWSESAAGRGELKAAAERPVDLANALEAIFGAVFVDAGFDAARP
jgi:ribonuclease-3